MKYIELLAPAKDFESAKAAIDYGADAVYIGGAKFGARKGASNSIEEIGRVVEYAHQYGARVFATVNTVLYDEELSEVEAQARELIAAGVDALIVQDMALRRMNLPVELHSSTQMNNMTEQGAQFLEKCGFARVILERGLSLEQIGRICAATEAEVECFVHGAICVGYSGRCFFSRSMGPRSGNRGECSQPCRLAWDLVDERGEKLLRSKHLLSVKDFNLSARLGDMVDAGVVSFKIEGRLKGEDYIRNVVGHYSRALDRVIASREWCVRASEGRTLLDFEPNPTKSFTRGETEYFIGGRQSGVASFDTPKAVGEMIGRVEKVARGAFRLDGEAQLSSGDGVCFKGEGGFVGTSINGVEGGWIEPNRMDGIEVGSVIYRNYDHKFTQLIMRSRSRRVIDTVARIVMKENELELTYTDSSGLSVTIKREGDFAQAQNEEKMREVVRTQLSKSGDTIFNVESVAIEGGVRFVPSSVLSEARREALESLLRARIERVREHKILPEQFDAIYPSKELKGSANVTNALAEEFYRSHGVEQIERGWDLDESMRGREVLRSAYCIRREIGECLKKGSRLRGDLFIERGAKRYRVDFDCSKCEMSLIDIE